MPGVAFPDPITRAEFNTLVWKADKHDYPWRAYADIGWKLIREGVTSGDTALLQVKKVFISMLQDNDFTNRRIDVDFFDHLRYTLKKDRIVRSFVADIKDSYNRLDFFPEMVGRLHYNKIVASLKNEDGDLGYLVERVDANSLKHVRALVEYFLSIMPNRAITIKWKKLAMSQPPEVMFFRYIREGYYRMLDIPEEIQELQEPIKLPMDAYKWCCDCARNGNCCSSLAVLRILVLNPDLAIRFLDFLRERDEKQPCKRRGRVCIF